MIRLALWLAFVGFLASIVGLPPFGFALLLGGIICFVAWIMGIRL